MSGHLSSTAQALVCPYVIKSSEPWGSTDVPISQKEPRLKGTAKVLPPGRRGLCSFPKLWTAAQFLVPPFRGLGAGVITAERKLRDEALLTSPFSQAPSLNPTLPVTDENTDTGTQRGQEAWQGKHVSLTVWDASQGDQRLSHCSTVPPLLHPFQRI